MKNWKTTLVGALAATATAIETIVGQGRSIADWKTWILPAALALFGYLSHDAQPTP